MGSKLDITDLITDIKHGKLCYSYGIALKTEKILEHTIANGKWNSAQELMNIIKMMLSTLIKSLPQEATANNVIRHVLNIVREEYDLGFKSREGQQSLHHLITGDNGAGDYSKHQLTLRQALLDHLAEYRVDLESSIENIISQAPEHIHSNELILTIGQSYTVEKFLKSCAKSRKIQVIVVESAPNYHGHAMAVNLSKSNIQTTVIPDSAIFALMSRVNKVIISTHTVMANGGLRAECGVYTVALAAKHYSVPVMVLVHMYKLSPVHVCSYEHEAFNVFDSPAKVIPNFTGPVVNNIHIHNPMYDYVPPELVTLFITPQGGNAPSYIYRLLSELYHPDDNDL